MEVSNIELVEAKGIYLKLRMELPEHLQQFAPTFERFLSPANYGQIPNYGQILREWYVLSITGEQRFKWLTGPHARTLFRVYVENRKELFLTENKDANNN